MWKCVRIKKYETQKIGKNIIDSNAYKVIIKPALNIATSGFYEAVDQFANAIFSDRKNEFISFLNDNYELLQDEEILKNEHFVSGLGILYQEIIKQRFEWKRQRMFGIFLGFINENDKEDFELERMFYTMNLISENESNACFEIAKYNLSNTMTGQFMYLPTKSNSSNNNIEWVDHIVNPQETIWGLIRLNIFIHVNTGETDNYILSEFGKQFIKSLNN